MLGSIFSFFITKNLLLTIVFTIISISTLIFIAIWKKQPKYVLIPLIAFIIGVSMFIVATKSFEKSIDYAPSQINARIYNVSNESNGMIIVNADSVKFDEKDINDNITIIVYDYDGLFENIEIGAHISFKPNKFFKNDLFDRSIPNSKMLEQDLKYTATALIDDITYIKTDRTFAEKVKENIKDNLKYGLTNENAEIAYSALFGDKDLLSDKQYNVYKLSGVAHLLAVSGLHVGILVGILNWFCKRVKIKKWYRLSLIVAFLLFYMYICEYSVSVVRASIMSVIAIIAGIMQREYDPFNAIAVAGSAIFLFNPLCIFDASFLLSFACVLGITILYMPIEKVLKKTKMSDAIVKSVAMSLSTTISIVFIMAYFFRTLNIISIIANVILIPIFTLGFTVVFVVSMLSLILSRLGYILYPIKLLP